MGKIQKKIKFGGSALAAEICAGPHNRLLRRQHCSSLCSQSEGDEYCGGQTRLKIQQSYARRAGHVRYVFVALTLQAK